LVVVDQPPAVGWLRPEASAEAIVSN
jgi:hypothetical protein